jgi:hypothetical protein
MPAGAAGAGAGAASAARLQSSMYEYEGTYSSMGTLTHAHGDTHRSKRTHEDTYIVAQLTLY